jgi:hypothetical protein
MGLAPHALITLSELTASYVPTEGIPGADVLARRERAINAASAIIEDFLDRRLVYRAPPEATANIVAEVTLVAAAALTVAAQPTSPGRTLVVTKTDADRSLTAGLVTITGTVAGVAGTTEVFDLGLGPVLHGCKFFTAISGIACSGLVNAQTGDTIKIGSSQGYVEYHSPGSGYEWLWTYEWPVYQVLYCNEDITGTRTFATSTDVIQNSTSGGFGGFVLTSSPRSRLERTWGAYLSTWSQGRRSVKLIYSAGYFTSAKVPDEIKDVAGQLAALLDRVAAKGQIGVSSQGDSTGNYVRFGPAALTKEMVDQLTGNQRGRFHETGVRDFDLDLAS